MFGCLKCFHPAIQPVCLHHLFVPRFRPQAPIISRCHWFTAMRVIMTMRQLQAFIRRTFKACLRNGTRQSMVMTSCLFTTNNNTTNRRRQAQLMKMISSGLNDWDRWPHRSAMSNNHLPIHHRMTFSNSSIINYSMFTLNIFLPLSSLQLLSILIWTITRAITGSIRTIIIITIITIISQNIRRCSRFNRSFFWRFTRVLIVELLVEIKTSFHHVYH